MTPDTILIASSFFGYHRQIIEALEAKGRVVSWWEDRPATDVVTKSLTRISPLLTRQRSAEYFRSVAKQFDKSAVKDVLVIKGEALSVQSIRQLRIAAPAARFTIYLWDSYRNMPRSTAEKVGYFDSAFSFDARDVESDPRLVYRPLFFVKRPSLEDVEQDLDLVFFGTAHTDRYRVLSKLKSTLDTDIRYFEHLYYPSRALLCFRQALDPRMWGAQSDRFSSIPLSRSEVDVLIARTAAVIDIERRVQSGFAPRVLEVIGASKKLVTTNSDIVLSDFYKPENIMLIDRQRPVIDRDFISIPYVPLPSKVLDRYTVDAWLNDLGF